MICDVGLLLTVHVIVLDVSTGAKVTAGNVGD